MICKLLKKGCVTEKEKAPLVVNPLTIAFNKEGKARLVLDCRHINFCIFKFKFKLEDASVARYLFKQGDFAFTFDLKSAYHHINIFEEHKKYLGFSWQFQGEDEPRYFIFNVLPFGISSAAHIFTKILRSVIKYWRKMGIKIIMYLDDGLGGANSYDEVLKVSMQVKSDLEDLGFLIAKDKSSWLPEQQVIWLGLVWNFINGQLRITEVRLERLLSFLESLISEVSAGTSVLKARRLAAVAGQIIAMQAAFGQIVRFRTRGIFNCLKYKASWNAPVMITYDVFDELCFWKENSRKLNGQNFVQDLSNVTENKIHIYSDASNSGYGGYILDRSDSEVIGTWTNAETNESSTWRELVALERVFNNFLECLEGQTIEWYTDNQSVAKIMQIGSKQAKLHHIASGIVDKCEQRAINLSAVWIPRRENERADMLSRCNDSDDWKVTPLCFAMLDKKWGPHTVDRFATDYNTHCARFNSRWWCQNTEQIDAFKCHWAGENNWLVPPPRLVCETIAKLKLDRAAGTLVVPKWQSAAYWPMIYKLIAIDNCVDLGKHCVLPGRGKNGIFSGTIKFNMIAVRLSFITKRSSLEKNSDEATCFD